MSRPAVVLADAAGVVTLAMGAALTGAPRQAAALVGLEDRPALARAIGLADLALAPWLLDRRRSRATPMAVRAALNGVIGAAYAEDARRPRRHTLARHRVVAMAALTVVDAAAAAALHRADRRADG